MTDRLELLMAETLDRVKDLTNEIKRLQDIVEPPGLPPVKQSITDRTGSLAKTASEEILGRLQSTTRPT